VRVGLLQLTYKRMPLKMNSELLFEIVSADMEKVLEINIDVKPNVREMMLHEIEIVRPFIDLNMEDTRKVRRYLLVKEHDALRKEYEAGEPTTAYVDQD